ncbi:MAG TPA: hypothetical protein VLB44_14215, partial [Kofleriaceae bacterium]|nr:hypothetical protein [Kofleriaceae bacterium]
VAPPAPAQNALATERLSPPGEAMAPVVSPPPQHVSKWIGVGLLLEPSREGGGIRADADVFTHDRFSFGVAISNSAHSIRAVSAYGDGGELTTQDVKLIATTAHTWQAGRWFLRGAFGAGAVYTHALANINSPYSPYGFVTGAGWFPTAELVGNAGIELGRNLAFSIGPAITMYSEDFKVDMTETSPYPYMSGPSSIARRTLELMILTGFKYRL